MKVLLVRQERESAEILSFILESQLKAEVCAVPSPEKGIESLLHQGAFDLILADIEKKPINPLFDFLRDCGAQIPIIGLTNTPFPSVDNIRLPSLLGFVDRANLANDLLPVIRSWIDEGTIYLGNTENDFCRIKTDLLLHLSPLLCDVYVGLSNDHFVKLFPRGHFFTFENFERIRFKKNLDYLFIKKEDCDPIVAKLMEELTRLIEAEGIPGSVLHNMAVSSHETVLELSAKLGFTREVQELMRATVRLSLKAIGRDPELSQALAKMNTRGARYLSGHSLIVAHVACAIASLLKWPSETTFQKLAFAGLCHDISLGGTKWAQLNVIDRIERIKGFVSPEDLLAFKRHPIQSALLMRRFDGLPPDVDVIIEQHHEEPYGTGFPHGISGANIAPLSSVFIVAHDIVDFTLETGLDKFALSDFLKQHAAKYSSGHFTKVVKALSKTGKSPSSR